MSLSLVQFHGQKVYLYSVWMVGEVRIVKAEFLQENNISMAKDSTNPLNIEWFSYENYDLDYPTTNDQAYIA